MRPPFFVEMLVVDLTFIPTGVVLDGVTVNEFRGGTRHTLGVVCICLPSIEDDMIGTGVERKRN